MWLRDRLRIGDSADHILASPPENPARPTPPEWRRPTQRVVRTVPCAEMADVAARQTPHRGLCRPHLSPPCPRLPVVQCDRLAKADPKILQPIPSTCCQDANSQPPRLSGVAPPIRRRQPERQRRGVLATAAATTDSLRAVASIRFVRPICHSYSHCWVWIKRNELLSASRTYISRSPQLWS